MSPAARVLRAVVGILDGILQQLTPEPVRPRKVHLPDEPPDWQQQLDRAIRDVPRPK